MDEELGALPRTERLKRYRALAGEFTRRAGEARHKSIRNAYEILAAQWQRLAEELESHPMDSAATAPASGRSASNQTKEPGVRRE